MAPLALSVLTADKSSTIALIKNLFIYLQKPDNIYQNHIVEGIV